ncbi:DUF3558 family protein [Saccharomonospora azurea]|uniref:DUF3558 family protein n=1 Tax=Saccharomonospora azurea TaxID=40988 RepID=UPI0009DAB8A8|nr:DUF3558 family protein [Saccharomonospora azurea]
MTRSISLLSALAAVVLFAAGCASDEPGIAETGPQSSGAVPAPSSSESPTPPVDPCTLMNPAEDLKQYGSFSPRQDSAKEMADAEVCSWQRKKDDPLEDGLVIGLAVRAEQGIDTVTDVGGGVNPGEINGREAAEAPDPNLGGCTLAIALTESSRVDVTAAAEEVNAACEVAREVAYLVEPRLPKA